MLRPSHDIDPSKVSSPRIFLVRMLVFIIIGILLVVILNEQIRAAFWNNPGLNGLIIGVLVIGILLAFRQVIRLFPEIALGLGCAKTKSDLVVMPSGRQIFAFSCSPNDHRAQNSRVNSFRLADPGLAVERPPVLLAPMAAILGDRAGRMSISSQTMQGLLDCSALGSTRRATRRAT